MGTEVLIVLVEQDESNGEMALAPLVAILRTTDGPQALDLALEIADTATITNGTYAGMPMTEHNGSGRFAMHLLRRISDGWDQYTTIIPITELMCEDGTLDTSEFGMSLIVTIPRYEGVVTHSMYDRPE